MSNDCAAQVNWLREHELLEEFGSMVGDALVSYLAQAVREERERSAWRDISTAPKDWGGRDMLVYLGGGVIRLAFWDSARGGLWSVWPGRTECHPTHWMPLPDPPVVGSADQLGSAERAVEDSERSAKDIRIDPSSVSSKGK